MYKKLAALIFVLPMLFAGCGSPSSPTLTGTVTYRQKIALPTDAGVNVSLQDISRADAPAIVLGQQTIETKGAQVPISFAIPYDSSKIDSTHSYSVRATIKDATGKMLFTSNTTTPVISRGNPTKNIEIILVQIGA